MKRMLLVSSAAVFCFFLFDIGLIHAEEATSSTANWHQELVSDRQEIKTDLGELKENSQAAKTEEEDLKAQIKAAVIAGDLQTAKQLRRQLGLMHQENRQERVEDKKDIQANIQELKGDIKEARQDGYLPPKLDKDNNPPGPVGGPGTNWENPPGPVGGPGTSPDRRLRLDRDNNPPGPKGGLGTNWENPPGPKGGPSASPNRRVSK